MRRRLTALLAMVAVVVVLAAAPAFAGKGGVVTEGSCGLGKEGAKIGIADPTSPGATEIAHQPPNEVGCTGKG